MRYHLVVPWTGRWLVVAADDPTTPVCWPVAVCPTELDALACVVVRDSRAEAVARRQEILSAVSPYVLDPGCCLAAVDDDPPHICHRSDGRTLTWDDVRTGVACHTQAVAEVGQTLGQLGL